MYKQLNVPKQNNSEDFASCVFSCNAYYSHHSRVIDILDTREVSDADAAVPHLVHSVVDVLSVVLVFGILVHLMESCPVHPVQEDIKTNQ